MSLTESQPQVLSASPAFVAPATDAQRTKQSREAIKDITFGSIAGTCGKFIEYPFDTVKVRLQSQPGTAGLAGYGGAFYTGPLDCFQKSLASGGVRGLYRGVSAPLLGAAVETSSLFFSYRIAQEAVCKIAYPQDIKQNASGKIELPFGALLLCGAASGAFTSLLLTPIELVKCQMQAEPAAGEVFRTAPKSPISVIAAVWKHQGLLGFWRGQMGTLIRETGGSAAWFGSYEGVGALLKRSTVGTTSDSGPSSPVWHQLLAGACAGMSYNFIFYPADTIKSRLQTEQVDAGNTSLGKRSTFWTAGQKLWQEQGIKGMYRGCGITVARSAPSSAIIFAIFEWLRGSFA